MSEKYVGKPNLYVSWYSCRMNKILYKGVFKKVSRLYKKLSADLKLLKFHTFNVSNRPV